MALSHLTFKFGWILKSGLGTSSFTKRSLGYTAGSYSYVAVGATANTYDQLAKPVHRRIMFAGEHTCKVLPLHPHPDLKW